MLVDGDRLTPALLAAVCAKAAGRARTLELTFNLPFFSPLQRRAHSN